MTSSIILAQIQALTYCVFMLVTTEQKPNYELVDFASSISVNDIYANGCTIMDINSDGMPEVYLTASSGWKYHIFYYIDGDVHEVEDMEPWAWSNRLLYTSDGKIVMYTYPHTYGTDGILNYRIWQWGEDRYFLLEDLWRIPTEYGWNGEGDENDYDNYGPLEFDYISSDIAIDPFPINEFSYDNLLITQEEFERRIEGFDKAEIVLDPLKDSYLSWDYEWWKQCEEYAEYDKAYVIIRREILEELLSWK